MLFDPSRTQLDYSQTRTFRGDPAAASTAGQQAPGEYASSSAGDNLRLIHALQDNGLRDQVTVDGECSASRIHAI